MDGAIAEKRPFSWSAWIGGFFAALIFGCILNVLAGFVGLATQSRLVALLCGVTPGLIFGLVAFLLRQRARSFALGLFTGACVVALVGGVCSFPLVGQSFAG